MLQQQLLGKEKPIRYGETPTIKDTFYYDTEEMKTVSVYEKKYMQ